MKYTVKPLVQGKMSWPLGLMVMYGDMRTFETMGVYVWYIEGAKEKILVDAGVPAPGPDGMVGWFPVEGGGEDGLRAALSEVNTTPEEIDILILTHLHYDHCLGVTMFKNARIYLQKKEWEFAFNPLPTMRAAYYRSLFEPLEKMDLVLINGDYEVMEGLKLMFLPGHTPGLQGVALSTEKGIAVLTGDLVYNYCNLNPDMAEITDIKGKKIKLMPRPDLPFNPVGIHVNLTDWFDSIRKVIGTASKRDLIYPGHDGTLAGKILP